MKFWLLSLVWGLAALAGAAECGSNRLANPEFAAEDGVHPRGWQFTASEKLVPQIFTATGGVLRISEGPKGTFHEVYQIIDVEPDVSYWFEVDILCDALAGHANARYSYFDDQGKEVAGAKPLFFPFYSGPQRPWKRAAVPIPTPDPNRVWKRLKIRLFTNKSPGDPCKDAAIYFRNPSITRYVGQKNVPINGGSGAAKLVYTSLPPKPFTRLPAKYVLENGGVGHISLALARIPRNREIVLSVDVPKGVTYEFHSYTPGKQPLLMRRVPARPEGGFVVGGKTGAPIVPGMQLLFAAEDPAPEQFDLALTLTMGDEKVTAKVPVTRLEGPEPGRLPKARRFAAYVIDPISRCDETSLKEPLMGRLKDYWTRCGWVEDSTWDFTGIIHYRQTVMSRPYSREGQGVDGAPTGAPCDSSMIALGAEGFRRYFESFPSAAAKIKSAEHTMWDYEPYVLGPVTIGCFCDDCRKAFADEMKFDSVPDARTILRRYEKDWVPFRCRQRAKAVAAVVGGVKLINPKSKFALCTMPFSPGPDDYDYWKVYGIDLPLYRDFTDVFRSMNYGSGGHDVFKSVEREMALGKPVETLFENGWGTDPRSGRILAMQVLGGIFAGMEKPFIAVGLSLAEGDQLSHLRGAMQWIGETEHLWGSARVCAASEKFARSPEKESALWSIDREAADGTRYVLVLCTSSMVKKTNLTFTCTITPPAGRGQPQTVTLRPAEWRLLTFPAKDK